MGQSELGKGGWGRLRADKVWIKGSDWVAKGDGWASWGPECGRSRVGYGARQIGLAGQARTDWMATMRTGTGSCKLEQIGDGVSSDKAVSNRG